MNSEVIRDPAEREIETWRVIYRDRLTTPRFMSKGAALAYLSALCAQNRKPEYVE